MVELQDISLLPADRSFSWPDWSQVVQYLLLVCFPHHSVSPGEPNKFYDLPENFSM